MMMMLRVGWMYDDAHNAPVAVAAAAVAVAVACASASDFSRRSVRRLLQLRIMRGCASQQQLRMVPG